MSDETLTDDQRAIRDYFGSEDFQRSAGNVSPMRRRPSVVGEWVAETSPWMNERMAPPLSFIMGLAGLDMIFILLAGLAPLILNAMEDVISRSAGYAMMMVFVQTTFLPPIVAFSVVTVTTMFWYGSVLLRFLVGAMLVVPGCVVFFLLLELIEGNPPRDFLFQFSVVMFSQFLVAGTIALVVQMWSRWSLTHARPEGATFPPLGLRSIMELMVVAALGCAVFITDSFGDILEGILFFAAMGVITSLAVIATQIAFLREGPRSRLALIIAIASSIGIAFLLCAFFAVAEFGWDSLGSNAFYIILNASYGGLLAFGVMAVCLGWLRLCGWSCIDRSHRRVWREETGPSSLT